MIKDKLNLFLIRKEPSIFKNIKIQEDYVVCDYCKNNIILYKQRAKRTGGIVELPDSLTKKG